MNSGKGKQGDLSDLAKANQGNKRAGKGGGLPWGCNAASNAECACALKFVSIGCFWFDPGDLVGSLDKP